MVPHRYWPQDEHCQSLNIWTNKLDPEAKKPVLVWFHGGGYAAGSSIEQVAYEGVSIAKKGDSILVSVNHRLNILGYLDLSPFGEKYKNSANAGHADMVAALQWVHDNIALFGGDPENVTIFGQSGGGMKVIDLMQIPAADGLFQKGLVMSGVMEDDPLGAGEKDGTEIITAMMKALGFDDVARNSLDGVSDRDFCVELLDAYAIEMMHLSRLSEELVLWSSWEFQFVQLSDSYTTGSSIMPQKKNPDIAELVRGKTGRVYGALMSLLTTMKGIPLAYNKDMQEDKELSFDAMDTVKGCVALFNGMLATMRFNKDRMRQSANHGFTNATDAADYLVNHGVPFRDAHGIVGRIVLYCLDKKIPIDDMSLEELKAISPVFEEDIYDAISMETCVNKRLTVGAPGKEAMEKVIEKEREYLSKEWM